MKNFITIQFLNQKYTHNKENIFVCGRSIMAKFCPMLVEMPYSRRVINPKTYLNHELCSIFFLGSLAYKLVNL